MTERKFMLFDGRKIPNDNLIETDVCIVGAGASGISIALEFVNAPFRVALMESGGLKFSHKTQWLYRGENIGRPCFDLEHSKQRYFGGASNKWYGRCRPLDAIDFESRSWIPFSGWPFSRQDIDPYYKRAHDVCQLGPYDYDPSSWESKEKHPLPTEGSDIETKIFQFSPPTRFGQEYLKKISGSDNIKPFLFSNAVSICLKPSGRSVDTIKFVTLNKNTFRVRAKYFIMAASALENTRLLLASNDVHAHGIGNQNDIVGRFFMEHPHIFSGVLMSDLPPENLLYYKILDYCSIEKNLGTVGALGLAEDTMRKKRMLNACSFFVWRKDFKVDDLYFSKEALALSGIMDMLKHTTAPNINFFSYLNTLFRHHQKIRPLIKKRISGILRNQSSITLRTQIETIPNPDSRVVLSRQTDRLGLNRISLDWRLTRQDLDSYHQFQKDLFSLLGKAGIKVRLFNHELDESGWPVGMASGKHHMGTTRMHSDPKQGVVDPSCRVHGVENLYIAGSSVFPTSGQANPMLTVVALAIRMADHIKNRL